MLVDLPASRGPAPSTRHFLTRQQLEAPSPQGNILATTPKHRRRMCRVDGGPTLSGSLRHQPPRTSQGRRLEDWETSGPHRPGGCDQQTSPRAPVNGKGLYCLVQPTSCARFKLRILQLVKARELVLQGGQGDSSRSQTAALGSRAATSGRTSASRSCRQPPPSIAPESSLQCCVLCLAGPRMASAGKQVWGGGLKNVPRGRGRGMQVSARVGAPGLLSLISSA